jgi:hypothetical protein
MNGEEGREIFALMLLERFLSLKRFFVVALLKVEKFAC